MVRCKSLERGQRSTPEEGFGFISWVVGRLVCVLSRRMTETIFSCQVGLGPRGRKQPLIRIGLVGKYCHTHRPHQSLGNLLSVGRPPSEGSATPSVDQVVCHEWLGRLLNIKIRAELAYPLRPQGDRSRATRSTFWDVKVGDALELGNVEFVPHFQGRSLIFPRLQCLVSLSSTRAK